MPPASSSKKKFSIGSFASPKTRTTPDPEALQRLMKKTEVEGGGVVGSTSDSEVVAKPRAAIHSVAREAEAELEAAPSTPEIAPPPVPTLPTGRSRGRGTKEEPRVRAKDGERLRQTSIHLPVELHKRVRKYAFDQEVTLSAVMVDAIEAWLDQREGEGGGLTSERATSRSVGFLLRFKDGANQVSGPRLFAGLFAHRDDDESRISRY